MKPIFMNRRVREHAKRDAEAGLDNNLDAVVTAVLGSRPRAIGDLESAMLLERQARPAQREAIADQLEDVERRLGEHPPPTLLLLAIALSFVGEVIGCSLVLATLGYAPLERVVLAFGLAVGSTIIAGVASGRSSTNGGSASAVLGAMKRAAACVLFVVLACAMAWLRASSSDELTLVDVATSAIALLVATAAPAIATHWAASHGREVLRLRRDRRALVREDRKLTHTRERAIDARVAAERDSADYERDAGEVRAIYLAELRRARASSAKE